MDADFKPRRDDGLVEPLLGALDEADRADPDAAEPYHADAAEPDQGAGEVGESGVKLLVLAMVALALTVYFVWIR